MPGERIHGPAQIRPDNTVHVREFTDSHGRRWNDASRESRAYCVDHAIQTALEEDKSTVYVPANFARGWDVNAMPNGFDSSVRMVREGQQRDVHDVQAYGADPTFTNDSLEAFQEAESVASVGDTILVPTGRYELSSDWSVTTANLKVVGEGGGESGTNQDRWPTLRWSGGTDGLSHDVNSEAAQYKNLQLHGGGNVANVLRLSQGLGTRSGRLENLIINGGTAAGILVESSQIGTVWDFIDIFGGDSMSHGVRVTGDQRLNAAGFRKVRIRKTTDWALELEGSSGASAGVGLYDWDIENNEGGGVRTVGYHLHFYNPWFETNGQVSGDPDIQIETPGTAIVYVHLYGGRVNSPDASQSDVRVKFGTDRVVFGTWGTSWDVDAIVDANSKTTRVNYFAFGQRDGEEPTVNNDSGIDRHEMNKGEIRMQGNAVVSSQVTDADLGNTPNTGDAATDDLINALVNVVTTHGLGST